jgi:hypothetical protein
MTTKKKQNSKGPKSAKTRLGDLTPKKDARGGALPIVNQGSASGIAPQPSASATSKKHVLPPTVLPPTA